MRAWGFRHTAAVLLMAILSARALSAAEPVGRSPELTLVPGCRNCVSVGEVDFALHIACPDGKPLNVNSSRLILMGESGDVLASVEDPYRLNGTSEKDISISGGVSSELRDILARFAAISFSAILKVNDLYSNVVHFNVRADLRKPSSPGKDCRGSLEIEPISPGTHEIRFSLGGCLSNTIQIKVEK